MKKKTVIVFAPHPDDETWGCGGSIAKKISEGFEVIVVILTDGRYAFSEIFGINSDPTPEELKEIRLIVGDMPLLVPGIGAQGGDVERAVTNGKTQNGSGMIINSSRGIIYASKGNDFAEAARKATKVLRDQINQYR